MFGFFGLFNIFIEQTFKDSNMQPFSQNPMSVPEWDAETMCTLDGAWYDHMWTFFEGYVYGFVTSPLVLGGIFGIIYFYLRRLFVGGDPLEIPAMQAAQAGTTQANEDYVAFITTHKSVFEKVREIDTFVFHYLCSWRFFDFICRCMMFCAGSLLEMCSLKLHLSGRRRRDRSLRFVDLKKNFRIHDGNPKFNLREYRRTIKQDQIITVGAIHGYTTVGEITLPFPVYCDLKTLIRFIEKYGPESDSDAYIWRKMMIQKCIDPSMREDFLALLHPMPLSVYAGFDAPPNWFVYVSMACTWLFGAHFMTAILAIAQVGSLLGVDSFIYVFLEEIMNMYYGPWMIITVETYFGLTNGVMVLIPVLLHILLWFVPFPMRVLLHWMWNRNAIIGGIPMIAGGIDKHVCDIVAHTSSILDLLRKIRQKDFIGVGLWFGSHRALDKFSIFFDFLTGNPGDADAMMGLYDDLFGTPGEVRLLNEDSRGYTWYHHFIPTEIRRSPTFSKLTAFVALLMSSLVVSEQSVVRRVLGVVEWGEIVSTGQMVAIVASTVKACYEGIRKLVTTGNIMDFFDMPRDVKFVSESQILLMEPRAPLSATDIIYRCATAQMLIDGRLYVTNTAAHERYIDKLRLLIEKHKTFLEQVAVRLAPMSILLMGGPGVGKTTLIEILENILLAARKEERFPGDVINFEIHEKYPTASGANRLANVLRINDIPDCYTNFPMMDLLPLELVVQKVVDTFPLTFPAAAVEDKGLVLNNLKYLIMTSNFKTFVCPSSTDKCGRRLRPGVNVWVDIVNKKGKPLTYEESQKLTPGERNDAWKFTIMVPHCKDKHMSFVETEKVMDLQGFVEYVLRKDADWQAYNESVKAKFQDPAKTCACGAPAAIHFTDTPNAQLVVIEGEKNIFRCLTSKCEPWIMENWEAAGADSYLVYEGNRQLGTASVDFLLYTMTVMLMFCWFYDRRFTLQQDVLALVDTHFHERVNRIIFTNPYIEMLVMYSKNPRYVYSQYVYKAKKLLYKLKDFIEQYKQYFMVAIGAGAAYGLYRSLLEEKLLSTKPIYADQMVEGAMRVTNYRTEMNYTAEKVRDWGKTEAPMFRVDLVTKGVGKDNLMTKLDENLYRDCTLKLHDEGTVLNCRILALSPEWAILNKHYVQKGGEFVSERYTLIVDAVEMTLCPEDFRYSEDNEFMLFRHYFAKVPHNLVRYMLQDFLKVPATVSLLDGAQNVVSMPTTITVLGETYQALEFPDAVVQKLCCTPVMGKVDGGCFLAGAVFAGRTFGTMSRVVAGLLSKSWFEKLTCELDQTPFVNEVTLLNCFGTPAGLSERSELRNTASPYMLAIGTVPGNNNGFHSAFRKTMLYESVAPYLSEPYGIPSKTSVVKDGNYYSAFVNTYSAEVSHNNVTDFEIEAAVAHYTSKISALVEKKKIRLSPLSFSEAVFGCPQMGIERINFSTSVGPVLKHYGMKNKYDMFEEIEENRYVLREEVLTEVNRIDSLARVATVAMPNVDQVFKDEVRPISKVDLAKIRLFCVLCAAVNLYGRQLLMPLITMMLQHAETSECYGGMNAGSFEWDDLARRLNIPGFFHFDMDFSKFDVSHDARAFRIYALVMFLIAKACGYGEQECDLVYLFCIAFRWQLARFLNDLFLKCKGMPSGVICTLSMNSVINSILLRIAFLRIFKSLEKFEEQVRTGNVGDDNLNAVSEKIIQDFNMVTISKIYKELGYTATPAKKGNTILPYIPFEDLTFLKRKFVLSADLKSYIAPIDKDSIYKAFMFESRQAGVSPPARLADVAATAQRESFLHGRAAFADMQERIDEWFSIRNLSWKRLDYEELIVEYNSKSFRTFLM